MIYTSDKLLRKRKLKRENEILLSPTWHEQPDWALASDVKQIQSADFPVGYCVDPIIPKIVMMVSAAI